MSHPGQIVAETNTVTPSIIAGHCAEQREDSTASEGANVESVLNDVVSQLDETRQKCDRLRHELAACKFAAGEQSMVARTLVHVIGQVVAMTQRLFPDGPVTFEHARDPENPSDEWFVFDVFARGEYEDYRGRMFQWHREVERIIPGTLTEFRLSVMPM